MARKYDLISELYNRTCKTVVSNPQNWQAFLASACRNYKLRYDEQLLVYAQRPDATAVLEIEQWNKIFGRWVNRGARGIAVFADENRSRQRLTHYFDISDTHESRYSRTVPIWDMRQEYEADVIETLESTFGEIENKSSLAEAIMGAARNAAEDNIPDYLQDLYYATEGSSFEEVEEDIVAFIYKNVVTNSVAYMMMSRLGVDTDGYFELDDFRDVTNFNTQETLNALGFATSDIAEMGLTEISKTITALNRQNRIIVGQDRNEYNKVENNDERSLDDERTDLHDGGRLQPSEPETSTAAGSDAGQVRSDEERVSEGTSQSPLLQSPDEGRTDTALGGSGTESQQDGGNNPEPDGTERGSDRTDESGGYDEMGSSDELSSQFGTGNRESGSDIRLEYYDRTHEDKSLPFFGRDEVINEILRTTPHLSASLEEIKDYYERNPDNKDRTEYIKSIFNNDYTELTLEDGRTVGYKTFENVLHLWEGKYDSRTAQSYYDWAVIARHFEAMRLLGELSDSIKPLPSMDGQMTFILDGRAEEKKTSAFTFSQEIIDAVLANGSGFSEGKMRIYEQFEKSLSAKENADFLKNEYGWGGSYPVIIGAGIDESHDGKGITITKGIGKEKPHITLSWSQVEKRIGELIRTDRYLNPKEKEHYPQWLESQEERRAKIEETKRNREILSNAPPEQEVEPTEKEPEEAEQLQDVQYEYHLGDKVYIGASEYEILSVDDERVMLYDYDMPLFNKEFSRTEFDRKVRENPINEHLIVKEEPAEERNEKEPEPVVPAWEQKKKVKGFDLHPDVPMADRHTFNLRENEVETVGKKERFRRNIMAIQLLKKCQEENRFATPEEQIVLSKYVGWGGLSEAFDENNSAWATEYLELSSVLTPEEYASARESTLTAFYTPPEVITAIYKAMEQMGFKEGNLLEPSCGIGNFIGMDLLTYLKNYEPYELVKFSGNTYCTRTHDSLKISNGKWIWWSRGIGGRSALDYLIKVKGYSFLEAVETIIGYTAIQAPVYEKPQPKEENKPLLLPEKCASNRVITEYLFGRGIDFEIINYCISNDLIFESLPYHNVVFVGYDEKKEPKYAAYRSTNKRRIMGDCSGSKKDYSFRLGKENLEEVHLFECAIDLLSYATLAKLNGQDWKEMSFVSLSGVYSPAKKIEDSKVPIALEKYLGSNPSVRKIRIHFDNDIAGRKAAQTLKTILPDKYEIVDEPPKAGKDFNDFLCMRMGIYNKKTHERNEER